MVVASAYYLSALMVTIGLLVTRKPYASSSTDITAEVLSALSLSLALLSPAFFLSDFGYRHKLPFFKRRKPILNAVGLVLFCGLMAMSSGLAYGLHTGSYKAAAAREAARDASARADRAAKRAEEEKRRLGAEARADEERRTAVAEKPHRVEESGGVTEPAATHTRTTTQVVAAPDPVVPAYSPLNMTKLRKDMITVGMSRFLPQARWNQVAMRSGHRWACFAAEQDRLLPTGNWRAMWQKSCPS